MTNPDENRLEDRIARLELILSTLDLHSFNLKEIKHSLDRLHEKIDSRKQDRMNLSSDETHLGFPRHWGVKTSDDKKENE